MKKGIFCFLKDKIYLVTGYKTGVKPISFIWNAAEIKVTEKWTPPLTYLNVNQSKCLAIRSNQVWSLHWLSVYMSE